MEGILLIDKPAHKTAFSLVALLRKITGVKKIGHAGTLDPLATGVMVLLIGKKYTRKSESLLNSDKEYIATISLGYTTPTYDSEGVLTQTSTHIPTREEVENALSHFQGDVLQTPPMFSAKKQKGTPLYKLARQGIEVERKPALVTLKTTLLSYQYPDIELKIHCSKGTYIRSIAHDLGEKLQTGAYLKTLRRTRSGSFTIENCLSLDQVTQEPLQPHLLQ